MWEPLLLTLAALTIPFAVYVVWSRSVWTRAMDRKTNRYQRTWKAMQHLSLSEPHWQPQAACYELRQCFRQIQEARRRGELKFLQPPIGRALWHDWQKQREHQDQGGLRWHLDQLEVLNLRPYNLQNHPGQEQDALTVEIHSRRREYLQSENGYLLDGAGQAFDSLDSVPTVEVIEYWTFRRENGGWKLLRCDREVPRELAFVPEGT